MAAGWRETTEYLRGVLSSGLIFLKSELGIDLGLKPELCAPWVLLLTASLGLLLTVVLLVSVCRGASKKTSDIPESTDPAPPVKRTDPKPDEPKKKSRRKTAEKKAQRNGLAVEFQEDSRVESQESLEVKTDKGKKNKKKQKPPVKDKKTSSSGDGKEHDEGAWETKVSNREKRQQRRKDKGSGDGSASPGASAAPSTISTMEQIQNPPEEPESTVTIPASTPPAQREAEVKPPVIEASYVRETIVSPQVTPRWDEMLAVNGSGWSDLGLQLPSQMASVQAESWTSMTLSTEHQAAEPSVWPQDMEGSWTIVDGSHIPVSFSGLSAVPDLSWSTQPPVQVDDEWSGMNASEDPASDWNAPSEEWGNFEEQQLVTAVPVQQLVQEAVQESDNEKEKDEASAPGSGKAKKKKKKKKKVEEVGASVQVKAERGVSTVAQTQSTAGNILATPAGTRVEDVARAKSAAPVQTQQRLGGLEPTDKTTPVPTQKKTDESWESPKQVKKKKARRDT